MKEYYTPAEVAAVFDVKKLTVYRWIKTGKMHAIKTGSGKVDRLKIHRAEIERVKLEGMTTGEAAALPVSDPETLAAVKKALEETAAKYPEAVTPEIVASVMEKIQTGEA